MANTTNPTGAGGSRSAEVKVRAQELGQEAKQRAQDIGATAATAATDAASTLYDKAKEAMASAGQSATETAAAVGDRADSMTASVGTRMRSLAGAVKQNMPDEGMMGRASSTVAETLENSGRYLEEEGLRGVAEDATNLIRRNPIPAVLIGIGIGFLIGRSLHK